MGPPWPCNCVIEAVRWLFDCCGLRAFFSRCCMRCPDDLRLLSPRIPSILRHQPRPCLTACSYHKVFSQPTLYHLPFRSVHVLLVDFCDVTLRSLPLCVLATLDTSTLLRNRPPNRHKLNIVLRFWMLFVCDGWVKIAWCTWRVHPRVAVNFCLSLQIRHPDIPPPHNWYRSDGSQLLVLYYRLIGFFLLWLLFTNKMYKNRQQYVYYNFDIYRYSTQFCSPLYSSTWGVRF